MEVIFLFY